MRLSCAGFSSCVAMTGRWRICLAALCLAMPVAASAWDALQSTSADEYGAALYVAIQQALMKSDVATVRAGLLVKKILRRGLKMK